VTLLELAGRVAAQAGPGEAVEAFASQSVTSSVTVFRGEVEKLSSAETRGLGVRVVTEGRLGFASTADLSDAGLRFALAEARANAAYTSPDVGNVLPAPAPFEPLEGIAVPALRDVPMSDKVARALELERRTLAADPRIASVPAASYGDAWGEVAIASSTGVAAAYDSTTAYVTVYALAREGEETQTGLGFSDGRGWDDVDLAAAAGEATVRATRLLGARKPATARVPVVFDPMVTAQFLGVLADAVSAESVQKGRSLLAGRVGEPVLGQGLSLIDDGRLLDGPGAAPVDDEGVPTGRTVLVDGGELRGYLHNTETATRIGGSSTGNASRAGYGSTPGVAPTNLFLDGPTLDVAELLRRADGGLYVQEVKGVHSGVNPVSGEVSVGATGLWIRDGALGDAVREVTVSSTLLDMLRGVTALAEDRRFFPFGGSLAGATLLVGEMTVAGS
jgi:PmbA protein